jgi:hypothetical protein
MYEYIHENIQDHLLIAWTLSWESWTLSNNLLSQMLLDQQLTYPTYEGKNGDTRN